MVAGVIGSSIGPLAGDGLDEAFGLAISLGSIGFCEVMLEAGLAAGTGKEFGAIGGAAIGEDVLDANAVSLEDAGDLFVGQAVEEVDVQPPNQG